MITIDDIKKAYLLLKREVYYEHIDLFFRMRIAMFDNQKEVKFQEILKFFTNPESEINYLNTLLACIDFHMLPKKISISLDEKEEEAKKTGISFISNLRTDEKYTIEKVNYFIDAPIEIYIISMLWTMFVGPILDDQLSDNVYGQRLESELGKSDKFNSEYRAFKLYSIQYNNWRDKAIQIGLNLLENEKDVLLIALDFKECYYNLQIDWGAIEEQINFHGDPKRSDDYKLLTDLLKKIHDSYLAVAHEYLKFTHRDEDQLAAEEDYGIPVGLPSSRVIANWELRIFDSEVVKSLRPVYYGRYVDDILIVLNNPDLDIVNQGPESIRKTYLIDTGLVKKKWYNDRESKIRKLLLKVENFQKLYIQNEKLIFHYYNHQHSWAGLKEFQEELRKNASEFRFLPEEDQFRDLFDEAYDLHYSGSLHRFRSLLGISENSTKLSHFLYKQLLKLLLCNEKTRDEIVKQLFQFYKGKNIFDYFRLWERVFSLFLISGELKHVNNFYDDITTVIGKLKFNKSNEKSVEGKLKDDCLLFRDISVSMALGLLSNQYQEFEKVSSIKKIIIEDDSKPDHFGNDENFLPIILRQSNLLRHQYFSWPLLDYSSYNGNLCKLDLDKLSKKLDDLQLVKEKLEYSSRFIHFDETSLFLYLSDLLNYSKSPTRNKKRNYFPYFRETTEEDDSSIPENYRSFLKSKILERQYEKGTELLPEFQKISITDSERDCVKEGLRLGVVNIEVSDKNIKSSYDPRKKPNLSYKRQMDLFEILNIATKEPKCDILIFPEVCIPFEWLPFMAAQARRKNIGLVFGLEHKVIKPYAYNFVCEILPFKQSDKYKNALVNLRLKNHYSPNESLELERLNLRRPDIEMSYDLFKWREVVFSVYNCYELADIVHRGLFRSDVDLLIAVEYNPDVKYFSNLIESACRDVHCYAAQANSANYGDSRVVAPVSSEIMDFVRVKGGENAVVLKTTLDIESLRDFQSRTYSPTDKRFKPLPPGYDHNKARTR